MPLAWPWRVSPPTPPLSGLPGSHLQEHTGAQWPRETPTQVPGEWSERRPSQSRQAARPCQAAQGREGGGAVSTRDSGRVSAEATLKAMLNGALSSEGPGGSLVPELHMSTPGSTSRRELPAQVGNGSSERGELAQGHTAAETRRAAAQRHSNQPVTEAGGQRRPSSWPPREGKGDITPNGV